MSIIDVSEPERRAGESSSSFNRRLVAWSENNALHDMSSVPDLAHFEFRPAENEDNEEEVEDDSDSSSNPGVPLENLKDKDGDLVQVVAQESGGRLG